MSGGVVRDAKGRAILQMDRQWPASVQREIARYIRAIPAFKEICNAPQR
jgi:hypothetical protein